MTPQGYYLHHKHPRRLYKVIGVGLDTATNHTVVIYAPCYNCEYAYFTRGSDLFLGEVDTPNGRAPRFTQVILASNILGTGVSAAYACYQHLCTVCESVRNLESLSILLKDYAEYNSRFDDADIDALMHQLLEKHDIVTQQDYLELPNPQH